MATVNGINVAPMTKRCRLNSIKDLASADFIQEVSSVHVADVGEVQIKVVKGDFSAVPLCCQQFIARYVSTLTKQNLLHRSPSRRTISFWVSPDRKVI